MSQNPDQPNLLDSKAGSPAEDNAQTPPQRRPNIDPSWFAVLESEFSTPTMQQLRAFLVTEARQGQQVYPPGREIFNAFALTPFDQVRVVILGQDPYHGPGQAHGLCFSVRRGVRPPPSLVNIFKELEDDLGVPRPSHGELTTWAQQGVLLLNTVLTVRHRKPKSHAGKGWEQFTDRVIAELNTRREGLVFVLWGSAARQKAQSVNRGKHLVLTSPHPSPYSADRGFFGCKHFSKINTYLTSHGSAPIDWSLPDG